MRDIKGGMEFRDLWRGYGAGEDTSAIFTWGQHEHGHTCWHLSFAIFATVLRITTLQRSDKAAAIIAKRRLVLQVHRSQSKMKIIG